MEKIQKLDRIRSGKLKVEQNQESGQDCVFKFRKEYGDFEKDEYRD